MFIKIGDKLINTHHIRSIDNPMVDDVKREIEICTDEFTWHILEHSRDYPEALKAYRSLCEGATRFDNSTDKRYIVQMTAIYQEQPAYAVIDTETDTVIPNPSGLKSVATAAADKLNSSISPATGHDPATCQICAALRKRETGQFDNTIIVLNPAEEHLLRLIAEKPRAAYYEVAYEHAVKGLLEYGFIYRSNFNRHLYILKAGEKWLEEHPVGWAKPADDSYITPTIPTNDVLDVTEWNTGNEDDGTPFVYGKTAKNHYSYDMQFSDETEGLAETLNAYVTELKSLRNFHERTMKSVSAAHDYVKEHKLGLGGEDVVMLVIEDARKLRQEIVGMSIDLEATKNTNQHAERLLTDCKRERDGLRDTGEGLRNQNHELEMRNAELVVLLNRVKRELASNEVLPELHETIEATLKETDDDLPF